MRNQSDKSVGTSHVPVNHSQPQLPDNQSQPQLPIDHTKRKGGLRPGAGRKKGSLNKLTLTVKQNVINVFDAIGGEEHMRQWALDHPTQFYMMYAKLMPVQSEISAVGDAPLNVTLNFIKPEDEDITLEGD